MISEGKLEDSGNKLSSIRKLAKEDEVDGFDCGRESSNGFLKKQGLHAQASGSSMIFTICRGKKVVGYYTLSASSIRTKVAALRAAKGMPKNGDIPVILLGQLAVDKNEQGKGIGKFLLRDAIYRTIKVSTEAAGVRAMLVHAIDEKAKEFYNRYDFESCPASDLTMMLLMKDAKKVFQVE